MKKKPTTLFTLLEVLIVIFIILVLMSFVIPIQKGLRHKTNEIMCRNNLKQIGILTVNYTMDFEGYLPMHDLAYNTFHFTQGVIPRWQDGWHGRLATYVWEPPPGFVSSGIQNAINNDFKKAEINPYYFNGGKGYQSLQVFWCPELTDEEDAIKFNRGQSINRVEMSYSMLSTSYTAVGTFLGRFGMDSDNYKAILPTRLSDIDNQDDVLLLFEGNTPATARGSATSATQTFILGKVHHQISKNLPESYNHRPNFIHDEIEEFWYLNYSTGYMSGWNGGGRFELANIIMDAEGRDNIVACNNYSGDIQMISYKNPNLLQASYTDGSTTVTPENWNYYGDGYQYLTGNMNVLYLDMHVSKINDDDLYMTWWRNSKVYVGNDGKFVEY